MIEEGEISYVTTLDDFLINPNLFYSKFGQNRNILILPPKRAKRITQSLVGFNCLDENDLTIINYTVFQLPVDESSEEFGVNFCDRVKTPRTIPKGLELELIGLIFPKLMIDKVDNGNLINLGGSLVLGDLTVNNPSTYGSDVRINGYLCSEFTDVHNQITDDEIDLSKFGKIERY